MTIDAKSVPDRRALRVRFPNGDRATRLGIPEGFPLMYWPNNAFCDIAFSAFDWLHSDRGVSTFSMKRVVFDLRDWLSYCSWQRWDPEYPNDVRLAAWRTYLTDPNGRSLNPGCAESKVARVFGIYVNLHKAMPFTGDGPRSPVVRLVAGTADVGTSLLSRMCDDNPPSGPARSAKGGMGMSLQYLSARKLKKSQRWMFAGKRTPPGAPRPILTDYQADVVLQRLRSGIGGEGIAAYPECLCERDWMIGRAMRGAGCRADEASRISLDSILEMLKADRLPLKIDALDMHPLDALAADTAAWHMLMGEIDRLEDAGRETMSLVVTGKNGKTRLAPVGFGFVRDVLEVGIASARRAQLAAWRSAGWRAVAPTELFLSGKTKTHLSASSISGLLRKAFAEEPAIPGSGHRLRANYAVTTAIRIFGACLRRFGGQMSPAMVQAAFADLAAALGHSNISTTVTFYLDLARIFHLQGSKHQDRVLSIIQREIENCPERPSDAKMHVLLSTVRAVLKAELGSEFIDMLILLPEQTDMRRDMRPPA